MVGSPTQQDGTGYFGTEDVFDRNSEMNAHSFLVWSILSRVQTSIPVVVVAVSGGGVAPPGFVDVQPLVNQVDGQGNATPHGVIHNLPYMRTQGGSSAFIIDPKVGDKGTAIFASRDISSVKRTAGVSNPGSARKFDYADGIYIMSILNGTPTRYFMASDEGVVIKDPTTITLSAPTIILDGALTQGKGPNGGAASMEGPLAVVNDVTAGTISLQGHVHPQTGAQAGSGAPDTGLPVG